MTITIQRSRWGYRENGGRLRNAHGLQCCLGFVCEQAGITEAKCLDHGYPASALRYSRSVDHERDIDIPEVLQPFVEHGANGYLNNSPLTTALVAINDAGHRNSGFPDFATQEEREAALIACAAKNGVTFIFED